MTIRSSRARKIAWLVALSIFASVPISEPSAFAQAAGDAPKPKKKKPKTDAPAEAPAAPVEAAAAPAPAPAVAEATPTEPKEKAAEVNNEATPTETASEGDDVFEKAGKTYYFIGLKYTHTIIPKFMINLFVNEGATFHSNAFALTAEIRKDGFSFIPALAYSEYGTDNVLFWQKNTPDIAANYSMVKSSLKSLGVRADLLWSTKVHKNWDIEYGLGVGVDFIFGSLANNWVHEDANGELSASNGKHYTACKTGDTFIGCNKGDHQNADVAKVGGYEESSWANGGSKPNLFPHLAVPQVGVRYKPIKQVEVRGVLGFSLTGFFLGLNVAYGLEHSNEASPPVEPAAPEKK